MARPEIKINAESGKRLKMLLNQTGTTQIELAKKIHMSQQTISKIINGHANLTLDNATRIAAAFPDKCTKFWLLGDLPIEMQTINDVRTETANMIKLGYKRARDKRLAIVNSIEFCGFSVDCNDDCVIVKNISSQEEITLPKSDAIALCDELSAMLKAFAQYHFSRYKKTPSSDSV